MNNAPKKPTIPIILQFALVFWGASALTYNSLNGKINGGEISFALGNFDIKFSLILIAIAAVVAIIACLIIVIKNRVIYKPVLFVMAIILGVFLATVSANTLTSNQAEILQKSGSDILFNVEEDQKSGSTNNSANATTTIDGKKYRVKIQFEKETEEIHAGDCLLCTAKFSAASDMLVDSYWQNGLCASAKITNIAKQNSTEIFSPIYAFRNSIINNIRTFDNNDFLLKSLIIKTSDYSQAEELLNALICGFRIDLNNDTLYESFKNAGLAHVVAVSGAHLSIVTALVYALLKKLKLRKTAIIILQSLFILFYLVCAGIPISALRAAFMSYITLFSFFSKKRPTPLNAIGVCIIAFISINTTTSVSVSFALSAGSTLGIILFSNLFEYWWNTIANNALQKTPELIKSPVCLTLAASTCSQPLSVSIFNQLPLIAPLSNIVCTPPFTILCQLGIIAAIITTLIGTMFPIISGVLMWASFMLANVLSWLVTFLASLPYATIPVAINIFLAIILSVLICTILYMSWPKQSKDELLGGYMHTVTLETGTSDDSHLKQSEIFMPKLRKRTSVRWIVCLPAIGVVACICFAIWSFTATNSPTKMIVLDVEQGDSIILQSQGKQMMIDTGNKDSILKQRLAENGIVHLDGLFITHPDDDHCGSIDVLQSCVQVDNFYCAYDLTTSSDDKCVNLMTEAKKLTNSNFTGLRVGDTISLGNMELNVIWPEKFQDNGGNCDSLTLLAKIDSNNDGQADSTALLCGDAEKDEITEMEKKGLVKNVDIYKVGHHGSKNALDDKGAAVLHPKISVVSVGAKNRYGHPASSTLSKLSNLGSKIYRTDESGTLSLTFKDGAISVETQK